MGARGPKPGNRPHTRKPSAGPSSGNWGSDGTAKGASTSRIKPGDPDGIQKLVHDPDIKARNLARATLLKEVLFKLATTEATPGLDNSMMRINAIREFLNRVEGQPMATQLNLTRDDLDGMTDEQLAAESERLDAAIRAAKAQDDGARGQDEPDSVRH